jgi:hypothetical protein
MHWEPTMLIVHRRISDPKVGQLNNRVRYELTDKGRALRATEDFDGAGRAHHTSGSSGDNSVATRSCRKCVPPLQTQRSVNCRDWRIPVEVIEAVELATPHCLDWFNTDDCSNRFVPRTTLHSNR